MLQISLDHVFRQVAHRVAKITSRPEMLTPVSFSQARKLFKQLVGTPTFDSPHDLARRHLRRRRHQNVDMILADHTFQNPYLEDPHLKGITGLPDQLPHPFTDFPFQDGIAIFRYPDKVILDLLDRMAPVTVVHGSFPKAISLAFPSSMEMKSARPKGGDLNHKYVS